MRVEVAVRERLTEDVIRLVLAGPSGVVFRPGQFVIFRLPAPIGRRAYSMANLSNADGRLEFLIKRKVDGAASRFLFEVQPGQSVEIEGPYGRAYLREVSGAGIVGLAGGSGLAPILSIVRAAAQDGSGTPIDVYFGVNAAEQLFCLEELTALQDAGRNLRVHIALRAGASGTAFAAGDALDLMLAQEGDLLAKDLYMGGPAPMIDAAMTRVVRAGLVRADRVFFDRFV
jgi:NAD(P)H-flavin reductase